MSEALFALIMGVLLISLFINFAMACAIMSFIEDIEALKNENRRLFELNDKLSKSMDIVRKGFIKGKTHREIFLEVGEVWE